MLDLEELLEVGRVGLVGFVYGELKLISLDNLDERYIFRVYSHGDFVR